MRLTNYLLFVLATGIGACNNSGQTNNTTTSDSAKAISAVPHAPAESKLSKEGTGKLMDMMAKYYSLKNALVAANSTNATNAANTLAIAADSMQAFLQSDTAIAKTVKLYMDTVLLQSKLIAGTTDTSCEKQRNALGPLSNAVYGLLKTVDVKNAGVYRDFCPMAYDEKGGFWLSEESEIKNPYFGKKMIECGEVTDSM